jgi:plasmid replication initiation protein
MPEEQPKDITLPVVTPELLGVTPRYELQRSAISRSAHNLSATAQKIAAMATALIPFDFSTRTVSFSFTDFCNALGYEKGGKSFKLFLAALKECGEANISLEIVNPDNGKRTWQWYHWFSFCEYKEETGMATMTFSSRLTDFLKETKQLYSKIKLANIGKLKSRFGVRYYELCESYKSLAGKDGNPAGHWYYEMMIEDIRMRLGVPSDAYPETTDFTKNVVKGPINEVNKANLGIQITPERISRGRKTTGYRFTCEKTSSAPAAPASPPPVSPATMTGRRDKECARLEELYPDEFAVLYQAALKKQTADYSSVINIISEETRRNFARDAALQKLRRKHGIVK